jgi:hypothetical protein
VACLVVRYGVGLNSMSGWVVVVVWCVWCGDVVQTSKFGWYGVLNKQVTFNVSNIPSDGVNHRNSVSAKKRRNASVNTGTISLVLCSEFHNSVFCNVWRVFMFRVYICNGTND